MNRETQPQDRNAPQDSGLSAGGDILPTLLRYRDRHQWSWNLSARLINMYYGAHYTEKQLKLLYRTHSTKN